MSGAETVMLVEADILIRQPLAEYLRDCGFRVVEAANAAEARTLLREGQLRADCVLADVAAEPDEAFALAGWIREAMPEVEVILAGGAKRTAGEAGKLCNDGPALVKPYQHELVLDHIRRLLSARGGRK